MITSKEIMHVPFQTWRLTEWFPTMFTCTRSFNFSCIGANLCSLPWRVTKSFPSSNGHITLTFINMDRHGNGQAWRLSEWFFTNLTWIGLVLWMQVLLVQFLDYAHEFQQCSKTIYFSTHNPELVIRSLKSFPLLKQTSVIWSILRPNQNPQACLVVIME